MSPSTLFLLRVSTLIAFTLSYAVDFTPQWEPVVRGEIVIIIIVKKVFVAVFSSHQLQSCITSVFFQFTYRGSFLEIMTFLNQITIKSGEEKEKFFRYLLTCHTKEYFFLTGQDTRLYKKLLIGPY